MSAYSYWDLTPPTGTRPDSHVTVLQNPLFLSIVWPNWHCTQIRGNYKQSIIFYSYLQYHSGQETFDTTSQSIKINSDKAYFPWLYPPCWSLVKPHLHIYVYAIPSIVGSDWWIFGALLPNTCSGPRGRLFVFVWLFNRKQTWHNFQPFTAHRQWGNHREVSALVSTACLQHGDWRMWIKCLCYNFLIFWPR